MTEFCNTYHSPLGDIVLMSDGLSLTGLRFFNSDKFNVDTLTGPCSQLSHCQLVNLPTSIIESVRWLDLFFSGQKPEVNKGMPIRIQGTPFQQRVWRELMNVSYGKTTTYGEIARRVGCRSAQAVGQAIGRNPIAIIIPCHRVVGSDGSLTGYAYGIDIKRKLLELEGVFIAPF